jgi:hypothetical protein
MIRWNNRRDTGASSGIAVGDYLCSATKLVYVESIAGDRAVVEDCATGQLITVPVHVLLAMRPVPTAC